MASKRIDVQRIEIEDKPGSLQKLLAQVADAGVDLLCFTAFSAGDGRGKVYLSGKDPQALADCLGKAQIDATQATGFIVGSEDRVGAGADALKGLADAGVNGRAGAAMVCDGRYQMLIVVDSADADAAEKALAAG